MSRRLAELLRQAAHRRRVTECGKIGVTIPRLPHPQPRASQAGDQDVGLNRLGEVIEQTVARERDGLAQRRQPGDHDDRCVRITPAQLVEEIVRLAVGQMIIEQDEVERAVGSHCSRFGERLAMRRLSTLLADDLCDERRERQVILYHQAGEPGFFRRMIDICAHHSHRG